MTPRGPRFHFVYLGVVGGLVVAATWLRPATASLWLDELGTWWVVKDGLANAVDRAFTYQGQAPTYYVIEWIAAQFFGRSEFALRIVSLASMGLAAWLLLLLMRRLVDREAARLAVLGFIGLEGVAFAATDARPYAVGTALLVAATLALVRWFDTGGFVRGAVFVALALGTVWTNYVIGVALIPLAIYGCARSRGDQVRASQLTLAWIAITLGLTPLVTQLVSVASRRDSLAVPSEASIGGLLFFVVPPVLAGGLFLGLLLARLLGPITYRHHPGGPRALLLLGAWLVIPPVALALISLALDLNLYSARYYLSVAPAAAGVYGWILATIEPPDARRAAAVAFAVIAVLAGGSRLKYNEDWRGVAAAERAIADDATLVFLHPALVESAQIGWLKDPTRSSYLSSPASFYEFDGRLVLLPYMLEGEAAFTYLERVTAENIRDQDRFLLVTRYPFVPFKEWWMGRLGQQGWTADDIGSFGSIELVEFTKNGASRQPA